MELREVNEESCDRIILLKLILVKRISRIFHGVCPESFADSAKKMFKPLYWQQKHICECKRRNFFFLIMFPTDVRIGLKILRNIVVKYLFGFQSYFNALGTFDTSCMSVLKVRLSPSRKVGFVYLNESFKNNGKCFLFHHKNSFKLIVKTHLNFVLTFFVM